MVNKLIQINVKLEEQQAAGCVQHNKALLLTPSCILSIPASQTTAWSAVHPSQLQRML
jgi:hypothetical protein